ncbi:ABC transporter ATP-binding protein [candidate division WOR-3 bacterium]|nr:ABC transporter ATP-binding protein [candidate division WOR-3 bacterium]
MTNKNKKNKQGLMRLLEIAGQKKWKLFISGFLAVISAVLTLAPFIIIYLVMVKLLDASFGPDDYGYIWKLAWIAVGAIIGRFIILFISSMFSHIAAFDILYELRNNLAKHMGSLSMGYFTEKSSGEIKKIVSEDVEQIELFIAHHIPDLAAGVALPLLIIGYLFITDWRMALIALIPLPIALLLFIAMLGGSEYKKLVKKYHDSLEKMNSTIIEYIRGMPVVKVFNQTVMSFSRFKDSVYGYRDFTNAWSKKGTPPWAAFTVIVSSSLFFLLPFGVWFYIKGTIELSTLFLCLMLGSGYMIPFLKLAHMGSFLAQINEGIRRIDKILFQPKMSISYTPKILKNNNIEFKNVSFSYTEKEILHDISFQAKEGTVTALVGPSGAGKTTIAHLIPRMWDIHNGEILVGGINIKDVSQEKLMNRIGFVFQDIFMFSDTVDENIRMGAEGVQEEDIIHAAKTAQCHDFIEELPEKYNTIIGEAGTIHLSGGERQRIALARIILKNAPIIVLDEAIAYADAENEVKIQSAFAEIMKGKTVIVIAHRLSTITDADQIIVIDEGKIEEMGTHNELLKSGNLYKRMWDAHTSARNWTLDLREGEK